MPPSPARVTVVIPVWDSYAEFVPRAVRSVLSQPVPARVLVVDNASAEPIAAPDGCEVVRTRARLTRGAARNAGLAHVGSEYVVFLDADDYLVPGALERMVAGLDRAPQAPALVGRIVEPGGALYRTPRPLARRLARLRRSFAWANATWSLMPTQGCTAMRTGAVRAAGGYGDASHGEDWMLGARLAFQGPIVFATAPSLVYRSRPDSPGAGPVSRSTLLRNGGRVRARLREDGLGPTAIAALWAAQVLAVFVAQPIATALRRARGTQPPSLQPVPDC